MCDKSSTSATSAISATSSAGGDLKNMAEGDLERIGARGVVYRQIRRRRRTVQMGRSTSYEQIKRSTSYSKG